MKRTVKDHDGDPAVIRTVQFARFVFLRLSVARFGSSTTAHCYTPAQARRLAANLLVAARKAEKRAPK